MVRGYTILYTIRYNQRRTCAQVCRTQYWTFVPSLSSQATWRAGVDWVARSRRLDVRQSAPRERQLRTCPCAVDVRTTAGYIGKSLCFTRIPICIFLCSCICVYSYTRTRLFYTLDLIQLYACCIHQLTEIFFFLLLSLSYLLRLN